MRRDEMYGRPSSPQVIRVQTGSGTCLVEAALHIIQLATTSDSFLWTKTGMRECVKTF
jgi:hypothetical protein